MTMAPEDWAIPKPGEIWQIYFRSHRGNKNLNYDKLMLIIDVDDIQRDHYGEVLALFTYFTLDNNHQKIECKSFFIKDMKKLE